MSRKTLLGAVFSFALLAPAAASAWQAECSPGYWKNHTEVWFGICCDDTAPNSECNQLLAALEAQGNDPLFVFREPAAEFLDACFGTAESTPCEDDDP